jgi:putative restriction endonuclease
VAREFGEIESVAEGAWFADRRALHDARVHRPLQAGISGGASDGADSIVVSGDYEDDEDCGDVIIYTGHGGNDPATRRRVANQSLTAGNMALARSSDEGLPLRVVRGANGDPKYSPSAGFRYDGLYRVDRYWHEVGRSGYTIWRFRLVKDQPAPVAETGSPQTSSEATAAAPDGTDTPERAAIVVQRIVRQTAVTAWVKQIHDHECQLCGIRLVTPSGPYAEGAHIRPLGRPHDGSDSPANVLCLCPNCHVLFDTGSIYVDEGQVLGITPSRPIRIVSPHVVDEQNLAYHRERIGSPEPPHG